MKIAFLGTPEFALPSLDALIAAGHTLAVFTQPDKPQGRHARLTPPPVKVRAQENGIPVFQPAHIRGDEGSAMLREFAPDLMVTAAFGQLLSKENLAVPTHGCINVHGSLLPRYRGAAPIQWAIINGEKVTGITTMLTDVGLDTGDMLQQRELRILPNETAGELSSRMAVLGAEVLTSTIEALISGTLTRTPQDAALATKCTMLKKEDGRLDFFQSAQQVHDRVRGTNPWPGAYALLDDEPLKIWRTRTKCVAMPPGARPGFCFVDETHGLCVCCFDAALEIAELQARGAKRMAAAAYLRGRPLAGKTLR
ncbi:methionyl-tRNA formyltransferase [Christensenellaceae bacterium OttesenSCG-928-L17]|nr:methionyl-tRNA formyltransferase [Christensenellaceae bacterium OttesenSCG-928-L17]